MLSCYRSAIFKKGGVYCAGYGQDDLLYVLPVFDINCPVDSSIVPKGWCGGSLDSGPEI